MSALELKLEDWDVHETYTKDYSDALGDPAQNADYKWAGTTDFRGVDVFKSLNEFLQPNSDVSLETAAESILKLLPEAPYSNEVAEFGRIVIELARQIPYHHPAHVKLAALMEEVTMSTKLMKPDGHYFSRAQRLSESMRDAYNGPLEQWPEDWPNLMAFYAQLASTQIFPLNNMYAIWTMREAFEERRAPWKRTFEGERDQWIIGAAQFILWDGLELFKQTISPELTEEETALAPGLLCFSEHKLTRRRWNFWREGFKKAAEEEGELGEECKKVARKAANLMLAIEESLTF